MKTKKLKFIVTTTPVTGFTTGEVGAYIMDACNHYSGLFPPYNPMYGKRDFTVRISQKEK